MNTRIALEVSHLSKNYGSGDSEKRIFEDLTFSVNTREAVSIVGPSGAGKTTLLRCLAGLEAPTSGRIEFAGKEVMGPQESLAVVFQDYSRSLMPWLTVRHNVELPLRAKRELSKAARSERASEAISSVGLGASGDMYPWQLSGGMQQRVAIARALAYEPAVLLMDEPFASVDAQTRADLEDLTLTVREKYHVTLITVTHDIEESVYLSDRVLVLLGKPTSLAETVPIGLAYPRDQVGTKEEAEFISRRTQILQRIRSSRTDLPKTVIS